MLKKPDVISFVYNDGVIKFYSKVDSEDEYGTPIPGGETVLKLSVWFRRMSARTEDIFQARAMDQDINLKVGLRGDIAIDTKWSAEVSDKSYEVFLTDYNPKNDETIVSLKEV